MGLGFRVSGFGCWTSRFSGSLGVVSLGGLGFGGLTCSRIGRNLHSECRAFSLSLRVRRLIISNENAERAKLMPMNFCAC